MSRWLSEGHSQESREVGGTRRRRGPAACLALCFMLSCAELQVTFSASPVVTAPDGSRTTPTKGKEPYARGAQLRESTRTLFSLEQAGRPDPGCDVRDATGRGAPGGSLGMDVARASAQPQGRPRCH